MSSGPSVPVSALIITKNEEKYIERALGSLTWCDEIIIVDALSTDKTKTLATRADAPWARLLKFEERAWSGFRDQRNHSLSLARNEWVLIVDADEWCSPELEARVRGLFKNGAPPHSAYKVRRVEYFLGKAIENGIWNPSYQDRFFKKSGVQYKNDIHEYPIFASPPQSIHEALHHAPDFHPEKFLDKMNKYTTIEAKDRVARGQRTNLARIFLAFPAMFLKNYFYYGAHRDGAHGFVISCLEGLSRVVRHVKIWQFSRELEQK